MKSGKLQKIIGKVIILPLMLTWLSACSFLIPTVRVKVDSDCVWFEDQTLSSETKEWLTREPWPDSVREDFDAIADNNDLYIKYCKD